MQKTKSLTICAFFTTLMAIGAFIRIPGPFLPMTLQTFFVILSGLLLGSKKGLISMLLYTFIGLIGLPVFTEGGGLGYVLKPSFGFILGFCFSAYCIGLSAQRKPSTLFRLLLSSFLGLIIIYTVGLFYYSFICRTVIGVPIPLDKLFIFCFLLPLPGDIISCVLASLLARRLLSVLDKFL